MTLVRVTSQNHMSTSQSTCQEVLVQPGGDFLWSICHGEITMQATSSVMDCFTQLSSQSHTNQISVDFTLWIVMSALTQSRIEPQNISFYIYGEVNFLKPIFLSIIFSWFLPSMFKSTNLVIWDAWSCFSPQKQSIQQPAEVYGLVWAH